MGKFNIWHQLFIDGEYAPAKEILSGLKLKEVTYLPSKMSHTIYDELWHTAKWQNIVITRDENEYELWKNGACYPAKQPKSKNEWEELVNDFLVGLDCVMQITESPKKLKKNLYAEYPGYTLEASLYALTVHNAYHLAKIVSVRQLIGNWPPKKSNQ